MSVEARRLGGADEESQLTFATTHSRLEQPSLSKDESPRSVFVSQLAVNQDAGADGLVLPHPSHPLQPDAPQDHPGAFLSLLENDLLEMTPESSGGGQGRLTNVPGFYARVVRVKDSKRINGTPGWPIHSREQHC